MQKLEKLASTVRAGGMAHMIKPTICDDDISRGGAVRFTDPVGLVSEGR